MSMFPFKIPTNNRELSNLLNSSHQQINCYVLYFCTLIVSGLKALTPNETAELIH